MANENAKNFVEKYVLNDGEKVLWEGRPKSIKFFEEPHTTLNIIRWAISAILVFCAFKYWAYGSAISIEANVHVGTTLFLLFCAALIAIRPFLNIRNLQNRIHYIITDKRVIAYRKKDSETAFIQCRNLKDFTEATIVSKEGNLGDLYIGPENKRRSKVKPPGFTSCSKGRRLCAPNGIIQYLPSGRSRRIPPRLYQSE